MATILIVSKTQMHKGICVGGIIEQTCELIRIHNERGGNLSDDAPYEIGDRWIMNIENAWNVRPKPHIEDKQTSPIQKVNNVGISGIVKFIKTHNWGQKLTIGCLEDTFEGCMVTHSNKNFINREKIPSFSTQFWIADSDLIYTEQFGKHYYKYKQTRLKFVGFQEIVKRIPAGTIIRLSLANWWDGDGSGEDRCYLQLSGWYL